MEQLSPIYESSVSESVFTLDTVSTGLSQHESNRILRQLMTSIDLHQLASLFYKTLHSKLNANAVKIQFSTGSLTIGDAENSCNIKTLDLFSGSDIEASVSYCLSQMLNVNDSQVLQELHTLFQYPLKNALEHYRVKQLAMKDSLTGLGNRTSYREALLRQIGVAQRQQTTFTLLLIDMDKFKQVNDSFGHQAGDKVLLAMADVMQSTIRDSDYAFRLGGDEFCCLLTDSDEQDSQTVAERLQRAVRNEPTLREYDVSCSIGSASHRTSDDTETLFARADSALYAAKGNGRNCIHVA